MSATCNWLKSPKCQTFPGRYFFSHRFGSHTFELVGGSIWKRLEPVAPNQRVLCHTLTHTHTHTLTHSHTPPREGCEPGWGGQRSNERGGERRDGVRASHTQTAADRPPSTTVPRFIHDLQRMNPHNPSDDTTFPLAPPSGQNFNFSNYMTLLSAASNNIRLFLLLQRQTEPADYW